MMIFDFVLRGAWKPMSKTWGSGAAWMLILLIATTMFVAVNSSSWLSSDEKKSGCLNGQKFEGACKDLNVDVQSKSGTIKATMDIKKGKGEFDGSITIGSCKIDGTFSSGAESFTVDPDGSFNTPIEIVATDKKVSLKDKHNKKGEFCTSPFKLKDKSVETNVKLHVDTENIVSLALDSSVEVVAEHYEEPGFWTRTWDSMPLWLWIIIFVCVFLVAILIIVGIVVYCCCYKKQKKADPKASNANLENGNKQMVAHAKTPNLPKDKLQNADKKQEDNVKGEKKDNKAVKKDNAVKKDKKVPEIKPKDEKKKEAVAPNPSNNNLTPNPSNVNVAKANPSNVNLTDSSNLSDDYSETEEGHQEKPTQAFAIMFLLKVLVTVWNSVVKKRYESRHGLYVNDDTTQRETGTDDTQYDIGRAQNKLDKYMTKTLVPFTMPPNTDKMNNIKWTDVHQNYENLSKDLLECFDVANISQYQFEGHMRKVFDVNPLKPEEAKVFQQKHEELKRAYNHYLHVCARNLLDREKLYQIIGMILYCYEVNQKTRTSCWHKAPFFDPNPTWFCCNRTHRRR
ncbi:hypothetical protein M3Y95_00302600 [Aphelenchoides besseyi]|nr:hypothetical protein M3Y95_00302600 [Aphelenchoides besseyi]